MSRDSLGVGRRADSRPRAGGASRWLWFAALWCAGVATVTLTAAAIRWTLSIG